MERRGILTPKESPSRNIALSNPESTGCTGRCARSACCSDNKRRTSAPSMLYSATGVRVREGRSGSIVTLLNISMRDYVRRFHRPLNLTAGVP